MHLLDFWDAARARLGVPVTVKPSSRQNERIGIVRRLEQTPRMQGNETGMSVWRMKLEVSVEALGGPGDFGFDRIVFYDGFLLLEVSAIEVTGWCRMRPLGGTVVD